ncbi:MAG: peptide ABC transporter substrate-binding protein [Proteobacteria bacterium]|nr:peptide ABC transporter substrate-binding protein [Pseudomonadota bacterium]
MRELELRGMVEQVRQGTLHRRAFIKRLVALGLTAPMAAEILTHSGIALANTPGWNYAPTKRGGGGALRLLYWQAPTLLNPHFATGTKDQEGARIFYEPLAAYNADGALTPILASEIPSRENGGLSEDGLSVIWRIKKGVKWHDGTPLTADDLVFTWEYARDPKTAATTLGFYQAIEVEKIDEHAIRMKFAKPTPYWAEAYVGTRGMILPKHLFKDYMGEKSRDAPANLKPVGTGPYKFVEFTPGDLLKGVINPEYHMANKPHFDSIELKGGGDAVSAARAVLQTGEYDFAWNIQVEEEIIVRLERGGKGVANIVDGGNTEHIQVNSSDPWTEIDGERSHAKSKHPLLSDPAVRKALSMLVDRKAVQEHIYGRAGIVTANYLNNPPEFNSKNTAWEFNIEKATKLLDDAGWKPGSDGIRVKDGKRLKLVYQTSTNAQRQKTQAIVKQACQKAGIEIEIKSVVASVFFSSDVANPDTYPKFYADLQMFAWSRSQPDPGSYMQQFVSWQVSSKENKWQLNNVTRWTSNAFDEAYNAAQKELDPIKRAALFIRMNDMIINDQVIIPIVFRPRVSARAHKLRTYQSGWDVDTGMIQEWYREA